MKYIIIIGLSRAGMELAKEMSKAENVAVLDKSLKAIDCLGDDFNGKKIWGDALDMKSLEDAGIKDADAVFLLTGNDNLNMVIGKIAKRKYGIKKVVLQVNDVVKKKLFSEEGLTIVNPTYLTVGVLKKCI